MIEFKPMMSDHDGCSYHQAKTLIGFWCRQDVNIQYYIMQKDTNLNLRN